MCGTTPDGTAFLMLVGPEPDVMWERFVEAVRGIIARLGVRLTVGVNAFPMNLPHTRPTRVILHGSRPELFEGYQAWLGGIIVPASAGHLLEFRLGEAGNDALGMAAPVPPYVTDTEYPGAAAALVREISARTGLRLPTADLDAAAAQTRLSIDEQIQQSDDLQAVVRALEEQYDTYLHGQDRSLLADGARPADGRRAGRGAGAISRRPVPRHRSPAATAAVIRRRQQSTT